VPPHAAHQRDDPASPDLDDIVWIYNTTPRKCLGFLMPIEFAKSIGVALEF